MALGSITTAAAAGHGGGPPGEHTDPTDSICLWMGQQLPIPPDGYSWQREEARQVTESEGDKEEQAVRRRGKEKGKKFEQDVLLT